MTNRAYLVDASVALKWFLEPETKPDAGLATELIGRRPLLATTLCFFEVGNTLSRHSNEPGRVARALEVLGEICGEPAGLSAKDFHRSAELVAEHRVTFYDASYVAIAERLGRTLISADRDLLEPGLAIDLAAALASP